eukprot:13100073-Alexandrium_andersonii.AAC.1
MEKSPPCSSPSLSSSPCVGSATSLHTARSLAPCRIAVITPATTQHINVDRMARTRCTMSCAKGFATSSSRNACGTQHMGFNACDCACCPLSTLGIAHGFIGTAQLARQHAPSKLAHALQE